jgi:hypothetical protein
MRKWTSRGGVRVFDREFGKLSRLGFHGQAAPVAFGDDIVRQ